MELQSGLEGCEARFVSLFVKALAFVVQLGFRSEDVAVRARFESSEAHPFVKVHFVFVYARLLRRLINVMCDVLDS